MGDADDMTMRKSSEDNKNQTSEPDVSGAIKDKSKVDYAPKGIDPSSFKYYPENPESSMNRYMFSMKGPSEYFDPCQESAQMSLNCLDRNDYNRDLCKEYFDAYRECKKQWLKARRQDRSQWE